MTHLVRHRRRTRAAVLLAAVAILGLAAPAPAAGASVAAAPEDELKWSVVPSSPTGPKGRRTFDYELNPKERLTDWVGVTNLTGKPLTVNLYATDAFNAPDGGFALLTAAQTAKDVGTWITLPSKQITIPADKRADIPFTLTVPPGAEPGDHIGGVIGSITEQAITADGQRVNVERRIAARVYLRVAGPLRPDVAITAVDVDYDSPLVPIGESMTVTYRIANHGNVRLTGRARVQITGPLGVRLGNSKIVDIPELLPDSEYRLTESFGSVFPAGRLTASVVLNPEVDETVIDPVDRSTSVWAVPWAVVGALLVLLALVAYRLVMRRVRRRRAASVADEVGAPDLAVKPA